MTSFRFVCSIAGSAWLALAVGGAELQPVTSGPTGERAFRELAAFLAGRPAALTQLLAALDDATAVGKQSGEWQGRKVTSTFTRGDDFASRIFEWRIDDRRRYPSLAPEAERGAERLALKEWLRAQSARISAGQPPEMKPRE